MTAPVFVALALLTAGCSGGTADGSAAPGSSRSASTASASASPTPLSTPTPVYPTNAAGCHPDKGWSAEQAAGWVKFEQIGVGGRAAGGQVHFDRSSTGFDGPLCEPVTVQVQYWKITYRPADDGSSGSLPGSTKRFYFSMESLKRSELHIDGRKEHDVRPPKSFAPREISPCVGFLSAIYAGKPLTSGELPTDISTHSGPLLPDTVDFPTKRVADYRLTPPSAPGVCDRNGRPTASPPPTAPATGAPGQPTYPMPYPGSSTPSLPLLTPKPRAR
ncbi:hypothetical protein ACWCP6_24100 [Streptomyces sp. NPDC002004]